MWRASDAGRTEASGSSEVLRAEIERARRAVQDAYVTVRRLVFDRRPPGPVDQAQLDHGQRRAMARWREAEHTLDGLRRAWHRGGHREAHIPSRPDPDGFRAQPRPEEAVMPPISQCSSCSSGKEIELEMTTKTGEVLTLRSCLRCETRTWWADGRPVGRDEVLQINAANADFVLTPSPHKVKRSGR